MDQTNDQQGTNQNQTTGGIPSMQPQAPTPVQTPSVPVVSNVVAEDKIDMSTQQDINPDDLRNKLNETLPQMPVAPASPASTVDPVQAVTPAQNIVTEQQPEKHVTSTGASVVVYTIENCPFCKAEKDYLTAHAIQFEEKRVDSNEANLKEMLALSDNFAGVPVTHLKGESSQRIVKGFTEAEFAQELTDVGFLKLEATSQAVPQAVQEPVVQQPVAPMAPNVPAEPVPVSQPTVTQGTSVPLDQAPNIPDFPQK